MNQITNAETKISALLAFSQYLTVAKFIAITDNDHESTSFVINLQEPLRIRNMEMLDWLVFTPDDSFEYIILRLQKLQDQKVAFLLVTENLTLADNIFSGAEQLFLSNDLWIIVSDLDVRTLLDYHYRLPLPQNTFSLNPKKSQEITTSRYVDDAVHSITLVLVNSPDDKVISCPNEQEMRRSG